MDINPQRKSTIYKVNINVFVFVLKLNGKFKGGTTPLLVAHMLHYAPIHVPKLVGL